MLEAAVEQKMEDQADFIDWCIRMYARKAGLVDTKNDNADKCYRYSMEEAEKLTGITQQQVSRCRRPSSGYADFGGKERWGGQ